MYFTEKELAAIYKLATAMIETDGNLKSVELEIVAIELAKLSNGIDSGSVIRLVEGMELSKAFEIVKNLTTDEKKYVAGFLAAISLVDGEVASTELAVWRTILAIGNFPSMNFKDALTFWANMH